MDDWKKEKSRIVKGLKFTCDLHSRGWGTWIDLVQEIGQLGRLEEEWFWSGLGEIYELRY